MQHHGLNFPFLIIIEHETLVYFKVKLCFRSLRDCMQQRQAGRVIYRRNGKIASPVDLHVERLFQEIDSFYTEKSTTLQQNIDEANLQQNQRF